MASLYSLIAEALEPLQLNIWLVSAYLIVPAISCYIFLSPQLHRFLIVFDFNINKIFNIKFNISFWTLVLRLFSFQFLFIFSFPVVCTVRGVLSHIGDICVTGPDSPYGGRRPRGSRGWRYTHSKLFTITSLLFILCIGGSRNMGVMHRFSSGHTNIFT